MSKRKKSISKSDEELELPKIMENHPAVLALNSSAYNEPFTAMGNVPAIMKTKIARSVEPDRFNPIANRILFMVALAEHGGEIHALARAIGREDIDTYRSQIIHGTMRPDGTMEFDKTPVKFSVDGAPLITSHISREDPRIFKIRDRQLGRRNYFTFTEVPADGKHVIGLASTSDFKTYEDHGTIIPNYKGFDPKDIVLFQEPDGRINMLPRFKPGIQLLRFNDIHEILALGKDPEYRQRFWDDFVKRSGDFTKYDPERDYLHPKMPQLARFEADMRQFTDGLIDNMMASHPNSEHFKLLDEKGRNNVWYGGGSTPIRTPRGWLDFPHRGQIFANYDEKAQAFLEKNGIRVDDIKLYNVLATLHDLDDPKKLKAAMLVSHPNPHNEKEMSAEHQYAVPFVKIAAGAMRVMVKGKPNIVLPVGVNDNYTRIELFDEEELLDWMLANGSVES